MVYQNTLRARKKSSSCTAFLLTGLLLFGFSLVFWTQYAAIVEIFRAPAVTPHPSQAKNEESVVIVPKSKEGTNSPLLPRQNGSRNTQFDGGMKYSTTTSAIDEKRAALSSSELKTTFKISSVDDAITKPSISSKSKQHPKMVDILVSESATVTASVRGNLGPPEVIVDPKMDDWLKDRWQAASNMQGVPIPGEHFLRLTLQKPVTHISRVVLDFEKAFAKEYKIEGYCPITKKWNILHGASAAPRNVKVSNSDQHIVHSISISKGSVLLAPPKGAKEPILCEMSDVRVVIKRPATRWGTSLWRVEVWGRPVSYT